MSNFLYVVMVYHAIKAYPYKVVVWETFVFRLIHILLKNSPFYLFVKHSACMFLTRFMKIKCTFFFVNYLCYFLYMKPFNLPPGGYPNQNLFYQHMQHDLDINCYRLLCTIKTLARKDNFSLLDKIANKLTSKSS